MTRTPAPATRAAWAELLATARRSVADGLVTGTSGNVSVRVDDPALGTLILVTPTGVPYGELGADDLVAVDPAGRQVLGTLRPTSELPLHLSVHRDRPEARAVVHTHAAHATAVSLLVDEVPPVHYVTALFGGPVRVAPYALYGTEALADAVRAALTGRTACLLAHHGTLTLAADLPTAYDRTAQLDWLCQVWLLAAAVPGRPPRVLSPAELDEAARKLSGYGQPPDGTGSGRTGD
ncbi:class II aldolase/adducin family protein [Streptomyces sp. SPB074]|uniref:class II aldolase/adducin family protein n=1 Tax=Streptomyces sp. (strain SPB074) TaxID=465543 RepID=UPI00017F0EC5|nr:class II aldolase/adducin family protein [Streptomyces sp. SPB074]EDY45397.2 L-fuculose phosphate aldolase [Streptomyces sp. SPB074]